MARKSQPPPKSFEDALAELEQILSDIEGGEVPLEQSLTMYERGQFLIGHCRAVLARAEKQIEVLGKNEPAAAAGDVPPQPATADAQDAGNEDFEEENEDEGDLEP
jgi:exodeoxyribonuclease VII small subunit